MGRCSPLSCHGAVKRMGFNFGCSLGSRGSVNTSCSLRYRPCRGKRISKRRRVFDRKRPISVVGRGMLISSVNNPARRLGTCCIKGIGGLKVSFGKACL